MSSAVKMFYIFPESLWRFGFSFELGYNCSTYYYKKNAQNDIIAILDIYGNVVVEYKYDAWGNHKVLDVNGNEIISTSHIGHFNPFRYRSYFYDVETGLYYLKSRYYDPKLGRFISPDDISYLDPNTVNGLNLYAYCNNNPVMYADPSGHWIDIVFDLFSLGVSIVEVAINPLDPWAWAGLAGDAIDLIPFVTGVGETIKGVKVVKKGVDLADDTIDTIKVVRAVDKSSDFAEGGLDIIKALNKTTEGFTISNRFSGTKIHKTFMKNGTTIDGTRLRVDGLDNVNLEIYELKPFNKNSLKRGVKQIIKYKETLGKKHKMIIVLY